MDRLGEKMTEETKEKIRKEMEKQMLHFDKEEMERRMNMVFFLFSLVLNRLFHVCRCLNSLQTCQRR